MRSTNKILLEDKNYIKNQKSSKDQESILTTVWVEDDKEINHRDVQILNLAFKKFLSNYNEVGYSCVKLEKT
mgnify:CR=1 FL=1